VTDERRQLLEAIGYNGAGEDLLSQLGPWAKDELEKAIADGDVRFEPMSAIAETTGTRFPAAPPPLVYKLTEQGAAKIGLDPSTLV
jgi:hypothetical protein